MVFGRLIDILKAEIGDKLDDFQVDGKTYADIDREWEAYMKSKGQSSSSGESTSFDDAFDYHFTTSEDPIEKEYYKALELPYGASFEQVKASYKRLIKQYHPDKFQNDAKKHENAIELTQKLNIAYGHFKQKQRKK